MTLRLASATDVPQMAALDALAGQYAWNIGQLAGVVEAGARALLAEQSGDLRGFVLYSCALDEATVLNIAVHPASQGRGLGHDLLETAMQQMRDAGMRRCLLEVRESNEPARRLYRGAGFETDGVRKGYYPADGGREDALLLSRTL